MQSAVPDAVDLGRETKATKALYGLDEPISAKFGTDCLIARRLVERGVRFVQIFTGSAGADDWDAAHADNDKTHRQMARRVDQPMAGLLKDLKTLVHLNLRGHPITDAQLAHLKPLSGLTRLHLEKTKVTDKGLENLKGLTNLEYLNRYGTEVTDAGLANLEGLKKLSAVYLWQTKATKTGAAKLKTALAKADINLGYEEPPKAPERKEEPKDKDKAKKTDTDDE